MNNFIAFDGLYKWFIRNYSASIKENYVNWASENMQIADKETRDEMHKVFFIGTIDQANSNIARYLLFKYGISFINQIQIDVLE